MPLRPCLTCGALSPESRCPTHTGNGGWQGNRDVGTQYHFRKAVLAKDGNRCAYSINGFRCPNTTNLQAHHTEPGNNDPATGLTLCRAHHRLVDKKARLRGGA